MYFVGRFFHLSDVDHESFPPKAVKKGPQIKENRRKKHDMYHDDLVLF